MERMTSGCRRASLPSRNSIQAAMARQKSVSSRSTPFASLSLAVLLAACHSAPPKQASQPAAVVAPTARAPAGAANAQAAAANAPAGTPLPAGAVATLAADAPVPPRAAQQY